MKKYSTLIILILFALFLSYKAYNFSVVEIYVMRHGATDKNKDQKLIFGESDLPLNKKGKEKIEKIAQALPIKNQILYASPQKRALETAEIIANATQSEVKIDPRLRERDSKENFRESKENQLKRILDFFQDELRYNKRNMWVITHGGVIGELLGRAGITEKMPIKNGSIFVFTYNKITQKISFDRII